MGVYFIYRFVERKLVVTAMKVAIIGGGGVVGSTAAYRIAQDGIASEIVLVDARPNMAEAHALDIEQAVVRRAATRVRSGGIEDTRNSDVIIMAVGAVATASQTSRGSFLEENIGTTMDLVKRLAVLAPSALWMIATIPVDTFVYLIHRTFSIPRNKVIGVNGNDTSRFRWAVAKVLSLPAPSVEAFVLGEHGETLVPVFSQIRVNKEIVSLNSKQKKQIRTSISDWLPNWVRLDSGRSAGWTTAECIGGVLVSMASGDDRAWACAAPLAGEYGYRDIAFGVPVKMGPEGVKEIVELDLIPEERDALNVSAEVIRKQIKQGSVFLEKGKS
jgi:malate dehydrogenase